MENSCQVINSPLVVFFVCPGSQSWKDTPIFPENERMSPLSKGPFSKKIIHSSSNQKSSGDISKFSSLVAYVNQEEKQQREASLETNLSCCFFHVFTGRNLENCKLGVGIRFLFLGYVCKICKHPEGPWDLCIYACKYHTNQRNRRQICHTWILWKRTFPNKNQTKKQGVCLIAFWLHVCVSLFFFPGGFLGSEGLFLKAWRLQNLGVSFRYDVDVLQNMRT